MVSEVDFSLLRHKLSYPQMRGGKNNRQPNIHLRHQPLTLEKKKYILKCRTIYVYKDSSENFMERQSPKEQQIIQKKNVQTRNHCLSQTEKTVTTLLQLAVRIFGTI